MLYVIRYTLYVIRKNGGQAPPFLRVLGKLKLLSYKIYARRSLFDGDKTAPVFLHFHDKYRHRLPECHGGRDIAYA